jgi:hypothetical protein
VRCHNGYFVLDEKCKSGKSCVTEGTASRCAKAND